MQYKQRKERRGFLGSWTFLDGGHLLYTRRLKCRYIKLCMKRVIQFAIQTAVDMLQQIHKTFLKNDLKKQQITLFYLVKKLN